MDQIITSIAVSCLAPNRPKSLIEWNAQYEAQSLRHDWWFRAGAAFVRIIHSAVTTGATQPATATQLAHA
jgi:hypothetical protein